MKRRNIRSAWVCLAVGTMGACVALGACSGGGGSTTGSTGNACEDFFALTVDCYARAGRPLTVNQAACGSAAIDARTQAQIDCALASREAYCRTIAVAVSRDASALSPKDPEIIKLNACIASKTTASPCREAIGIMADRCGTATGFAPDCTGQSQALAKCIVDNPTGACASSQAGQAQSTEARAFLQCQIDASRAALDETSRDQ